MTKPELQVKMNLFKSINLIRIIDLILNQSNNWRLQMFHSSRPRNKLLIPLQNSFICRERGKSETKSPSGKSLVLLRPKIKLLALGCKLLFSKNGLDLESWILWKSAGFIESSWNKLASRRLLFVSAPSKTWSSDKMKKIATSFLARADILSLLAWDNLRVSQNLNI